MATAPARGEILAQANGRWTPRDIAFSLGRGLYSVMTDLAILFSDGLIGIGPDPAGRVPAGPPQAGRPRPDAVPIGELGAGAPPAPEATGFLPPAAEDDTLPPEPSTPAKTAELPRRRRIGWNRRSAPKEDG